MLGEAGETGAQRREQEESRPGREPNVGKEYFFHSLSEEAEAPDWSLESMGQSGWFRLGKSHKAAGK